MPSRQLLVKKIVRSGTAGVSLDTYESKQGLYRTNQYRPPTGANPLGYPGREAKLLARARTTTKQTILFNIILLLNIYKNQFNRFDCGHKPKHPLLTAGINVFLDVL
jgi:hypothetical protein